MELCFLEGSRRFALDGLPSCYPPSTIHPTSSLVCSVQPHHRRNRRRPIVIADLHRLPPRQAPLR